MFSTVAKLLRRRRPPVPQSEWEWFGDPGHFCWARWCRFHLCTKVGDYLVSTVGAYVHPRHSMGSEMEEAAWLKENWPSEDIGLDRKYETMVFRAGDPCASEACDCGLPTIDGHEIDLRGYNKSAAAAAGHLAMCKEAAAQPPSH